jgi:hypothetical protein
MLNRHDPSGLGSLASVPPPQRAMAAKPDRLQLLEQAVGQPEAQPVQQPEAQPVQQPVEQAVQQPVEQAVQQPVEPDYGGR